MSKFAEIIKEKRIKNLLKLKDISNELKIDVALVSKIERGERKATKKQALAFIEFYSLNKKEVLTQWLSEKILYDLKDEEYLLDALYVAEDTVKYITSKKNTPILDAEIKALIKKIDINKKKWESFKPLDKTQLLKMQEYFNVSYTYESNKIEGNTLTLQETHLVINEGLTISGKSMHEHLEAINHYDAIDFIADLVKNNEALTERTLKEIHYLILKGIDRKNAGVYRTVPVFISGSKHKPPQPFLIDKKMEEIFEFYSENKDKIHPVILAAEMHEKIVTVHPFIDGNGRTSRLIMNLILLMNGYTTTNIKGDLKSRKQYYNALEKVQTINEIKDFHLLVCIQALESLDEHINMAE